MSSPQDSETKRGALEKAQEGRRLAKRTEAEADQKLRGVKYPDYPPKKDKHRCNWTLTGLLIVVIVVSFIIGVIIEPEEDSTAFAIIFIIIVSAGAFIIYEVFGIGNYIHE